MRKFTNYFQLVYKIVKIVYNNEHKIGASALKGGKEYARK